MATETQSPSKVVGGPARLSYAAIHEPKANLQGKLKYSTVLLIRKTDTTLLAQINAAIQIAGKDGLERLWKGKKPANYKGPLRDGDAEDKGEEYKGMMFMSANSDNKPGLRGPNNTDFLDASTMYSGSWVKFSVNFYPYSQAGGNGVACGLNNLMLLDAKGLGLVDAPLAGKAPAKDDFASEGDGSVSDDMPF